MIDLDKPSPPDVLAALVDFQNNKPSGYLLAMATALENFTAKQNARRDAARRSRDDMHVLAIRTKDGCIGEYDARELCILGRDIAAFQLTDDGRVDVIFMRDGCMFRLSEPLPVMTVASAMACGLYDSVRVWGDPDGRLRSAVQSVR